MPVSAISLFQSFRKKTGKEEMDKKESILIVDDDGGTCRMLSLLFGKNGYETETAGTGREALEKTQERFFNVALLDIRLPDMEGTALLAPLKDWHPDMGGDHGHRPCIYKNRAAGPERGGIGLHHQAVEQG